LELLGTLPINLFYHETPLFGSSDIFFDQGIKFVSLPSRIFLLVYQDHPGNGDDRTNLILN